MLRMQEIKHILFVFIILGTNSYKSNLVYFIVLVLALNPQYFLAFQLVHNELATESRLAMQLSFP